MLAIIYKIILILSTIVYVPLIYLLQNNIFLYNDKKNISIVIYFLVVILLNLLCFILIKFLSKDDIKTNNIADYESINEKYAFLYFGYFFTALSINNNNYFLLIIISAILFLIEWTLDYYYNPILSFYFKFYSVKFKNGRKIIVITHKNIISIDDCKFSILYRINDNSYIDFGGKSNGSDTGLY